MATSVAITEEEIEQIVQQLRRSFEAGKTRSKEARERNLKALLKLLTEHENDMYKALYEDLHKSAQETQNSEIDMAKNETIHFLSEIDKIVKPQNANDGSLVLFGKKAYFHRDPYGLCLIIGAWNYPIQLTLMCLAGAIGAGNTVIVKPSELAPASAEFLERVVPQYLDEDCFRIINGGANVCQVILRQRFDHILFTGSNKVGRLILRAAAEHLTPVTLELGGKSPVFIDKTANIGIAAKRLAWAKLMNCGQTCIAPDYVMCTPEVKGQLIDGIKANITCFYGENPQESPDYGRIINVQHFDRLSKILDSQEKNIVHGGKTDRDDKYIEPTIFDDVTFEDPIMDEEIFGPLLPIITVHDAGEAIKYINYREKPLALYVFTSDKGVQNRFMTETSSGSLLVNELLLHAAAPAIPFGGVGCSGMGSYHGNFSIETFSHKKGCLIDPFPGPSDLTMYPRYPPFSNKKTKCVTLLTKTFSKSERRIFFGFKLVIVVALIAVTVSILGIDKAFI